MNWFCFFRRKEKFEERKFGERARFILVARDWRMIVTIFGGCMFEEDGNNCCEFFLFLIERNFGRILFYFK